MLEESQNSVLDAYKSRKKKNTLSDNLSDPTAANLRNECAQIFHERPNDEIRNVLQSFCPIGFQIKNADDILIIDPDKFRPLLNFINEDVSKASLSNVKLLAWLMNYDIGVGATSVGEPPWWKNILNPKWALFGGLLIITTIGILCWIYSNQCMYWQGDHYEVVGCKVKIDHATVIALDEQKVKRLKRITRLDTIGEKDLGKVWYVKIKVDSAEFYTDSGDYPLNTQKRLLPITPYILNKYILEKARPID